MIPGSVEACPASQTISNLASGQALCSDQALSSGVTTSKRPWTIHQPVGHVDVKTAAALIGGPFLFLLGGLLFKRAVFRLWAPAQIGGLLALTALIPVSSMIGPLALSIATTLVLLGVCIRETLVHGAKAQP